MESFPGPPNYTRPPLPPSSMTDPHHLLPPPPPPQASSWYFPQFHYHSSHSPSPPPPPQQQHQWGPPPPPPSDHNRGPLPHAFYPNLPHPPHSYSNQHPPPHRPHMLPPPPYSNSSQDWGNQSWVPNAGWEHQAHNNGEDWAAKARAWAAAKNATENQYQKAQSHYPIQYMHSSESHYHENEQINVHPTTYQNYPTPASSLDNQLVVHQPDPAAVSSVHAYYAPDGDFSYPRKDEIFSESGTTYPQQDAFVSPSFHKQEVPSSYSSIPGGQFSTEQLRGSGSSESKADQAQHFTYRNQSVAGDVDPSDQPLQFTSRFNHDNNPMMFAGYPDPANPAEVMGSVTAVSTVQPWTPPAPSISFPSAPPAFPSAAQFDPTINMPPVAGQPPPMLGRAPVPSFHSTVSSLSPPIGLSTGTSVHPGTAFHGDMYGTPMNSERPKKAAVPNWLRDEIIKKKDIIVSSGADHHKEESESIDDEPIDKFVRKIDQDDKKGTDSSKSTEEEDEVYEEVARTAAINQEIKRVLTEVLLKVTSDLFDEIAARVLDEDAKNDTNAQNHKLSPPPTASASKVSEKALNPTKKNDFKSEDDSEESSSGAAGNVLGLVNYESDDEEESGSYVLMSNKSTDISSSNKKSAEGRNGTVESCHSLTDSQNHNNNKLSDGNSYSVASSRGMDYIHASHYNDLVDHRSDRSGVEPPQWTKHVHSKAEAITDLGRVPEDFNDSSEYNFSRNEINEPVISTEAVRKASKDDLQEKDTRKRDRHENRSSSARDSAKKLDMIESRENNRAEQIHGRHDEKHQRKKNEDKDRSKEQGVKYGEKIKEDSKKQSPHRHTKEITREVQRHKKASEKDDVHRKSERPKLKHANDRARHKRGRSSSADSRDRNSKDNSVVSCSDNSTDEASEKSRRKMHLKRRNLSPSPVRSRRRQVSQSPPSSKASQRRQSPYYSLEASRGRRSRSRSPVHRRRLGCLRNDERKDKRL